MLRTRRDTCFNKKIRIPWVINGKHVKYPFFRKNTKCPFEKSLFSYAQNTTPYLFCEEGIQEGILSVPSFYAQPKGYVSVLLFLCQQKDTPCWNKEGIRARKDKILLLPFFSLLNKSKFQKVSKKGHSLFTRKKR